MNNVTIYTKDNCVFCTRAKMIMSSKGVQYKELKLNEDFTSETLKNLFPQARTYPVIVVDGFNIGGCNELEMILNEETENTKKFLTEG
jgi:glutaredoxin 3